MFFKFGNLVDISINEKDFCLDTNIDKQCEYVLKSLEIIGNKNKSIVINEIIFLRLRQLFDKTYNYIIEKISSINDYVKLTLTYCEILEFKIKKYGEFEILTMILHTISSDINIIDKKLQNFKESIDSKSHFELLIDCLAESVNTIRSFYRLVTFFENNRTTIFSISYELKFEKGKIIGD